MVSANIERRQPVGKNSLALMIMGGSLLLLPLGMGGNRLLPLALCQMGMAVAFLALVLSSGVATASAGSVSRAWPLRLQVALFLFLMVIIWSLLQTVSFLPASWHHPLWRDVSELLQKPYRGSISISPESTLAATGRLLTYGLMLGGVFCISRNSDHAVRLVQWFWYVGAALCLYAVVAHVWGFSPFLWIKKEWYLLDATGTFVNRNHFADYAGLTLLTGVALAWRDFLHKRSYAFSENMYFNFWTWLRPSGALYILALTIVFLSLVMTHSRAGVVSSFIGLTVFAGAFLLYQKNYRMAWNIPLICILVALCVVAIVFHFGRYSLLLTDGASRLSVYTHVMDLISKRPMTGYGLGSFEKSYMLFYDETHQALWEHVHNDWLEMVFDLGVIAAAMIAISLGLIISGCGHGIRTRRRQGIYPALGLGSSALMLSHAMFDFSLQIPGLMASWFILLGAGLGQSWSSGEKKQRFRVRSGDGTR